MPNTLKLFALESTDNRNGRGFSLRVYASKGRVVHLSMPCLYDTLDTAQEIVDEILENGRLDYDEIIVTPTILHGDGRLFDDAGNELLSHIAKQTVQSVEQVKEGFAVFYAENERRLRHAAEAASEGPGL